MWRVLATLLVVCSLTLGGCTSINAGGEAIECARAGPSAVICDGIVYHRSINAGRRGLQHNETSAAEEVPCGDSEEALVFGSAEFWIYTLVCAVLVCSAGLFSGLTIGLMSLDVEDLKLIEKAPVNALRPFDRIYASKIIPIVETNHSLLVTLLLSNAAAMEALPIFLDKICPSPVVAILLSVTLVLFFGEVIPQALCKAYGLQIGASTACFVKALMSLLYPIVWPIAKILDYLFGEEAKSLRRIDWVVKFDMMLEEFEQNPHAREEYIKTAGEQPLSRDELGFMKGVLGLFQKKVSQKGRDGTTVMVPWAKAYTIELGDQLNFGKMSEILRMGYSRIPVLAPKGTTSRHVDVVGVMLVKNLITLNPDDGVTVQKLLNNEEGVLLERQASPETWDTMHTSKIWRNLLRVHKDISIFALIDLFQAKKTQIAIVYDYLVEVDEAIHGNGTNWLDNGKSIQNADTGADNMALRNAFKSGHVLKEVCGKDSSQGGQSICGITTLEDILEEMFGEQFVDETDPEFCQWHDEMKTREERTDMKQRAWPTMDQLGRLVQDKLESGVKTSLGRSSSFGGSRMPVDMVAALTASSSVSEMAEIGGGPVRKSNGGQNRAGALGSSLLDGSDVTGML